MHPDPIDVRVIHTLARAAAEVLWKTADGLDHVERGVYRLRSLVGDAGHKILEAACTYTEERVA